MPRQMLLPAAVEKAGTHNRVIRPRIINDKRSSNPSFCDIDLRRWKDYIGDVITDSLWILGARDRTGPHEGDYHGNFVPQIAYQVITRYTKKNEIVLDLFNGMGTTLIECRHLGRHGIGVELNSDIALRSRERIDCAINPYNIKAEVVQGDSTTLAAREMVRSQCRELGHEHAHHVILHPPYWDIIQFNQGLNPADLAACPTLESFLELFTRVVENARELLESKRFLTLVIGDTYSKGEWIPLGFECMNILRNAGFKLKAINVKDIQGNEKAKGKNGNLWKYRALKQGFYVFKHEYIIIFQKA